MTPRTKLWIKIGVTLLVSISGLVLLTEFHMGHGQGRQEALGLSRLAWLDLHRLGSVLMVAAMTAHTIANGRSARARVLRALRGRLMRHDAVELVFYAAFAVTSISGFVAWWFLPGSPLPGGIALGPAAAGRHVCIDLHHVCGFTALVLSVHHLGHRWKAGWRSAGASRVSAPALR